MGALPTSPASLDLATRLFVGCYTSPSRQPAHRSAQHGVHVFDAPEGERLTDRVAVGDTEQSSFLAVRPDLATMYAVRETEHTGALVALRLDGDSLSVIDEIGSHGSAPCHVSTRGEHAFVANYGSGTVSAYRLRPDGTFAGTTATHQHVGSGPHRRQAAPHAHCIVPGRDGRFVYATDLGTDRIVHYHSEPDSSAFTQVGETVMPAGSGPRHLAFHPTRPLAFVVGELDCTLIVAAVDPDSGALDPTSSVSTLPSDLSASASPSLAAEIVVAPDGTRAYVSNRGHDSIATFAIGDDGELDLIGHVASGGRTPRHMALHPSGRHLYVANQDSDAISAFELDGSGVPRHRGVVAELHQPVCLVFAGAAA